MSVKMLQTQCSYGDTDGLEFALDGRMYELDYQIVDGDVDLPEYAFQGTDMTSQGTVQNTVKGTTQSVTIQMHVCFFTDGSSISTDVHLHQLGPIRQEKIFSFIIFYDNFALWDNAIQGSKLKKSSGRLVATNRRNIVARCKFLVASL